MERPRLFAFLGGTLIGAAALGGVLAFIGLTGVLVSPQDCPLEFVVTWLNTTEGWFYPVDVLRGPLHTLNEFRVTPFVFGPADPYGNQPRIIDYDGPLVDLVNATGNVSFQDRGTDPGVLDEGGDYFWAAMWHYIEVRRGDAIVGGTVRCL